MYYHISLSTFVPLSGLVNSVRRALSSKPRGPWFKSGPGTVDSPVTIIMWGARPRFLIFFSDYNLFLYYVGTRLKTSFELNPVTKCKQGTITFLI